MVETPYVGQRVRMSREGYVDLHLQSVEEFEQSKNMVITEVENMGYPHAPVWAIEVDQPLINQFLLHAGMVEVI